jgi:hypothetical protein
MRLQKNKCDKCPNDGYRNNEISIAFPLFQKELVSYFKISEIGVRILNSMMSKTLRRKLTLQAGA